MDRNIKIKGRLKWYLRWPILLSVIAAGIVIAAFWVDHRAGYAALIVFAVHVAVALIISLTGKPALTDELINFGLDYGQVQKKLL